MIKVKKKKKTSKLSLHGSNHSQIFFQIGVLKNFTLLAEKHRSWNLLSIDL